MTTPVGVDGLRLRTLGGLAVTAGAGEQGRLSVQPKRLALLAYLALHQSEGARSRDEILSLFWPSLSPDEGRRALRQALFHLRRALGPAAVVVRRDGAISVDPAALWCDAHAFERAVAAGRVVEAGELYQGEFLAGVQVADVAAEWGVWVHDVRVRLDAVARMLNAAPTDASSVGAARGEPRARRRLLGARAVVAVLALALALAVAAWFASL